MRKRRRSGEIDVVFSCSFVGEVLNCIYRYKVVNGEVTSS